jgi:hypothetical protein
MDRGFESIPSSGGIDGAAKKNSAGYRWFESISLQRRVNKLSVPFALARLPALFCFAGSGCTVLSYEGVYGDRYSSLLQPSDHKSQSLPALLCDEDPDHDCENHDTYHGPSQVLRHLQENGTDRRKLIGYPLHGRIGLHGQ